VPRVSEDCRIDVWLWHARRFRTRTLAADFVEAGRVRLVRPGQGAVRLDKPSRKVRVGDRLIYVQGGRVIEVEILGLATRRGSAPEAASLFRQVDGEATAQLTESPAGAMSPAPDPPNHSPERARRTP
jgi:ribosome-associated heat shock protein Hsp15